MSDASERKYGSVQMNMIIGGLQSRIFLLTRTSPSLQFYRHPRYLRLSTVAAASKSVVPFKLTDIGEGIAEVELLKWFVKVVTISMLQKNDFLLSYLISR